MAFAGSAIGLGNIWRFPYMVGKYGGAAFIILYIIATVLLALPMLLSETIIGRRSRSNAFGAMAALAPPGSGYAFRSSSLRCLSFLITASSVDGG